MIKKTTLYANIVVIISLIAFIASSIAVLMIIMYPKPIKPGPDPNIHALTAVDTLPFIAMFISFVSLTVSTSTALVTSLIAVKKEKREQEKHKLEIEKLKFEIENNKTKISKTEAPK